MTSLKESHAGDHMTSRRDDTRLKSEHMIFTDALDENASPNPQPTLTIYPSVALLLLDRIMLLLPYISIGSKTTKVQ